MADSAVSEAGDFPVISIYPIYSAIYSAEVRAEGTVPFAAMTFFTELPFHLKKRLSAVKKKLNTIRLTNAPIAEARARLKVKTCSRCGGSGTVKTQQRTPFGVMQSSTVCPDCGGKGTIISNPCKSCRGTGSVTVSKTLEVSIPAGIDDGNRISLRGMGNAGKNGGTPGDLFIEVSVRPHAIFQRDGNDIKCDIPITFAEAALGAQINVPTLEGEPVTYNIPEGTQSGTVFTVKGKGIPNISGRGRGNIVFRAVVEVPKSLTSEQKDALRKFSDLCGNSNYAKREKFFGKFRKDNRK